MDLPISIVNIISNYVGELRDSFKFLYINEINGECAWKINVHSTSYNKISTALINQIRGITDPFKDITMYISGHIEYTGVLQKPSSTHWTITGNEQSLVKFAMIHIVKGYVSLYLNKSILQNYTSNVDAYVINNGQDHILLNNAIQLDCILFHMSDMPAIFIFQSDDFMHEVDDRVVIVQESQPS